MDQYSFCFIICTNNQTWLSECIVYLNRLYLPSGYNISLITVPDASSMLSGYEEACTNTDALYKIFLHQDTFILNRRFLYDILDIFFSDSQIAIIGMAGTAKMPDNFIMWTADTVGSVYNYGNRSDYSKYQYSIKRDGYSNVRCADGFILSVKGTPVFRKDLFDGWDFYDVSMCMEAISMKKKIVIPKQTMPWCLHDDGGQLSMLNYDHYRRIAIHEYQES